MEKAGNKAIGFFSSDHCAAYTGKPIWKQTERIFVAVKKDMPRLRHILSAFHGT